MARKKLIRNGAYLVSISVLLLLIWHRVNRIPDPPVVTPPPQTATLESTAPDGTMLWYLSTATDGFGEIQRRFFADHPKFTCEYQGAFIQNGYTQGHWLKCKDTEAKP